MGADFVLERGGFNHIHGGRAYSDGGRVCSMGQDISTS